MRFTVIFIALILAGGAACKKKAINEDQYITLYYRQTFCADPWQNAATDSLTLVNISSYLQAAGAYVGGLAITYEGPAETCDACFCKTGKTIYVTTFNNAASKAKYLGLGFKQ